MAFDKNKHGLAIRIVALAFTIFLLAGVYFKDGSFLTMTLILILAIIQGYYIHHTLNRTTREVVSFLESIQWDDFSHTYPDRKEETSLDLLYKEFNNVIRKFREIRADKEAQYQYLKTIVQHVGIGIITFETTGAIQIINSTAKNLLGIKSLKNINQLGAIHEGLTTILNDLRTGGRTLIKLGHLDDEIQVAIYAIELSLRGKAFKLISLQNIQSELEEKEMEAWQNLIRVLTHEIMNSVTPISSLAKTLETEMNEWVSNDQNKNEVTHEQIEDFHMALSTIHKRSDSLIKFVSDFRNMTRITLPQLCKIKIKDLLGHICILLKNDLEENQIKLDIEVTPIDLEVEIDELQIEQVLINLIKNAIQALQELEDVSIKKVILINATQRPEGGAFLTVRDNGPGIEEEALKKIFIPFFTTKKSGSGIGLSLSKQIMRNHGGSISVRSVINEGTEFTLKFTG